ncbi:MAG: hypothetical protein WBZ33_07755 [Thermoactinomyces sp.]
MIPIWRFSVWQILSKKPPVRVRCGKKLGEELEREAKADNHSFSM